MNHKGGALVVALIILAVVAVAVLVWGLGFGGFGLGGGKGDGEGAGNTESTAAEQSAETSATTPVIEELTSQELAAPVKITDENSSIKAYKALKSALSEHNIHYIEAN